MLETIMLQNFDL